MDRIDDFFRKKMEQRLPEFNEAHWQAAEALLDQRGRRRRALWWWRIGLLVHALGAALILLWPSPENSLQSFAVPFPAAEAPLANRAGHPQADALRPDQPIVAHPGHTVVSEKGKPTLAPGASAPPSGYSPRHLSSSALPSPVLKPSAAALQQDTAFAKKSDAAERLPGISARVALLQPLPGLDIPLLAGAEPELPGVAEELSTEKWLPLRWRYAVFGGILAYPDTGNGTTTGLQAGASARLALGKGWGLQLRVAYRLQGLSAAPLQQQTSKQYGFGSSEQSYSLAPARLHYAEVGASANYARGRHRLGLGLNLSYLLGAEGDLLLAERTMGQPLIGPERSIRQGWIAQESLAEWVPGWQLSYGYALHPRLSAEAVYHRLWGGIGGRLVPAPPSAFLGVKLYYSL